MASKLERVMPKGIGEKPSEAPPRRRWWLGTLPGCPKRNLTLRGISFNARTGDFGGNGGRIGAIAELTEKQVDDILDALQHKVARNSGSSRPEIIDVRMKSYRHEQGDEPLANHLFLMPEDKAHLISGRADWAHDGAAPSVTTMLTRGDEEDDWCIGVAEKSNPADKERKRLEAELAKQSAELEELRGKLAKRPPTSDERKVELEASTVDQLRAYAEGNEIELPKEGRKADLIAAIITAEQEAGLVGK